MSGTLAVVSQTGESLSFFNIATGERLAHLASVTSEPHELCWDTKRNVIYMSHTYRYGDYWNHGENSHEISIVDVSTFEITGMIDTRPAAAPHGLVLDRDRDILYASVEELPHEAGGGIIGMDLETRQIVKRIPSQYATHWFVITPDAKKAYTSNKTASFISVLDLENERMVTKIDVPGCEEPSISMDGKYAYFPAPGMKFGKNAVNPSIKVIDTTTDAVVESIALSSGGIAAHVTSRGDLLVGQYHYGEKDAETGGSNITTCLAVIDGKTHRLVGEVPVGLIPLTVRSSPDGSTAFTANVVQGTVSVVDIPSLSLIRTIEVDRKRREDKKGHVGAHGMAVLP